MDYTICVPMAQLRSTKICSFNGSTQKLKGAYNSKPAERKNQDQGRSRSVTPEKRTSHNKDNRPPITCYNCQQLGQESYISVS